MRRFLALLTNLTLLHLMLVGGDLACASHGAGSGTAMPGMTMDMHGGAQGTMSGVVTVAGSHDSGGQARSGSDCATPGQARCCEAMSSCSVTTTVSVAERLAAFDAPDAAMPSMTSAVLESVLTAPDPPPPKA